MKTKLVSGLLTFTTIGAFAQGQVQFRNYYAGVTPTIDAPVYDPYWVTPLDNSNTQWRAALLGGPTTLTPANVPYAWSGAGDTFVGGTLPMLWNPTTTTLTWVNFRGSPNEGYVSVLGGASRVVPGVDWGGTALIQMVAWRGNYTTWYDAYNAFVAGLPDIAIGASNPLTLTLPNSPLDPNLTYLVGLQSFHIGWGLVPEPNSLALGALGATVLLVFRRRAPQRAGPTDFKQWRQYVTGSRLRLKRRGRATSGRRSCAQVFNSDERESR